MKTGMLWFDDDPKTDLPAKVQAAAAYYHKKYGKAPNLCLVNPAVFPLPAGAACGVDLQPSPLVLPNHLWLGIRELPLPPSPA